MVALDFENVTLNGYPCSSLGVKGVLPGHIRGIQGLYKGYIRYWDWGCLPTSFNARISHVV